MMTGLIPLVHAWKGADVLYPGRRPWDTIDGLLDDIEITQDAPWDEIVTGRFMRHLPSQSDCLDRIGEVIENLVKGE